MVKKYTNKLFCFSPPVMLATFLLELGLASWVIYRYKLNRLSQLAILILVFLSVFQLAEYMVCGGLGLNAEWWSRVGYVAITLLPPLGLHFAYELAGAKRRVLLLPAYVSMVAFTTYFLLVPNALGPHTCGGNYIIFTVAPWVSELYALYYYGFVLVGMITTIRFAKRSKQKKQQRALYAYAFGYAAFLLPTTTVNLLHPSTISGIPSIMCGFAVVFALVVALGIMPLVARKK